MKKFSRLLLVTIILTLISCTKLTPIEKFGGSKYIVAEKAIGEKHIALRLKSPDTIFWIRVLKFDGNKISVGDTIK